MMYLPFIEICFVSKPGISSEIGHDIEQNLAGWLEVDGRNTIIVAKNIRCDCKNPSQCRV